MKNYYETYIIPDKRPSSPIKTETKAESRIEKEPGRIDSELDSRFENEFTDGNMNTRT